MVFVNKAVLNSTPDLPFSFLVSILRLVGYHVLTMPLKFIQLVIAVLLLHLCALVSSTPLGRLLPGKLETPAFDFGTITKLLPLVIVGVVGLVFNTLCLRNVETSFFQVRICGINFLEYQG